MITFIPKCENIEVYNSKIIRRRSSSLMLSFFAMNDFCINNPASLDFLLDRIYIKRPRCSYITLFLKNIFVPACFPLNSIKKISKLLLFQLKKKSVLRIRNAWGYNRLLKIRISFSMTL